MERTLCLPQIIWGSLHRWIFKERDMAVRRIYVDDIRWVTE